MQRRRSTSRWGITLLTLSLAMTACAGSDVSSGDDRGDGAAPMERTVTTIDPAASTTTPVTELEPGCLSTIESTPEAPAVELLDDPLAAIAQDRVAPMPLAGHEDRVLVDLDAHASVDEYFMANPNIIAPAERRALMESGGFRGSVGAHFAHDADSYSVYAVQLGSPAAARAYFDEHVRRICRDAVGLRPLASPVGGFVYARDMDGAQVPRAVAVVDDVEISITICRCVGVADPTALAGEWLTAIVEQLRSPAAVPA